MSAGWSPYETWSPKVDIMPSVIKATEPVAKAASGAGGAATGAAAGAAGGPLGAVLGAGVGGLISLIGGLFGASAQKEQQIREAKIGAAKEEYQGKSKAVSEGVQNSRASMGDIINVYRNAMIS